MTNEEAIEILYKIVRMNTYSSELGGLAVDMAAEALRNQPSLPSNLDEAAYEYAWEKQEHHIDYDGEEYLDYGPRYDAFKAGVEWMSAQGVSAKGNTDKGVSDEYFNKLEDYLESLPTGTEIIFQVRKK